MDHLKQVQILRQLMRYVSEGDTSRKANVGCNDARQYWSQDVLHLEKERLFRQWPLVLGLSGDIPVPGSFLTDEVADVPILLVRGQDGIARAFLNACRHRGTRLVSEPRGERLRFSCPFHAWTYDPAGSLSGVPKAGSFGEVDKAKLGLIALPTVERYGIVWAMSRPGLAVDIEECLGGLGAELADWNLDKQVVFHTQTLHRHMNWKLANDTFGETYHFEFLHRGTLAAVYHSNATAYETFGRNHRMVFAARTIDELRQLPQSEWQLRPHSTIAYFLYPNTQLLVSRQNVALYRIFPHRDDPGRCRIEQSLFLDREATTAEDREICSQAVRTHEGVIIGEDFVVAESAQTALSSGLLPHVMYGRNEPALHHYHESFRRALESPSPQPGPGRARS